MIAGDTSTWVAYLDGSSGRDVDILDGALSDRQILMVPVVLTELLSDASLPNNLVDTLLGVPLIHIRSNYWRRAGELRGRVLRKKNKARLGDALIAQCCIDSGIRLLTRDRDFRAFCEAGGLDLVI